MTINQNSIEFDLEALCAFERSGVIGCARTKCVYLAVFLSIREHGTYPFIVENLVLVQI